jgi:CHASE3 domain sensor protein
MEPARLRESLRKQGIYVHESDPVLEVAAICELAVADTVKAIEGLNKAAADRISAASNQHIEAARQSAAALVTEAGKWSAEQLRETAAEISASILKDLRPEVLKAETAARVSVRTAWLTGSVGAIALAGLAGFLLAGLGHG